jgi:hypothetical protein
MKSNGKLWAAFSASFVACNQEVEAPDHTAMPLRSQHIDIQLDLAPRDQPIALIVESVILHAVQDTPYELRRMDSRRTVAC